MYLSGVNSDGSLTAVAYWRKANAIHGWFVRNVQDGIDECQESKVSREELTALLDICLEIADEVKTIEGKVKNGAIYQDQQWVDKYEDGLVITNPELCSRLLPTVSGFFFGSTDYNNWYLENTIESYG